MVTGDLVGGDLARDDVVGEHLGEQALGVGHRGVHRRLGERGEGVVDRREDGQLGGAVEGVDETGLTDGGDEGRQERVGAGGGGDGAVDMPSNEPAPEAGTWLQAAPNGSPAMESDMDSDGEAEALGEADAEVELSVVEPASVSASELPQAARPSGRTNARARAEERCVSFMIDLFLERVGVHPLVRGRSAPGLVCPPTFSRTFLAYAVPAPLPPPQHLLPMGNRGGPEGSVPSGPPRFAHGERKLGRAVVGLLDGDGDGVPAGGAAGEGLGALLGLDGAGEVGRADGQLVLTGGGVPLEVPLAPVVDVGVRPERGLLPRALADRGPRPWRCRGPGPRRRRR